MQDLLRSIPRYYLEVCDVSVQNARSVTTTQTSREGTTKDVKRRSHAARTSRRTATSTVLTKNDSATTAASPVRMLSSRSTVGLHHVTATQLYNDQMHQY